MDYLLGLAPVPGIDVGPTEGTPRADRVHEKDKINDTLHLSTSRIGSEQRGDEIIIIPNPASAVHTSTAVQAGTPCPAPDRTGQS